MKQLIKKFTPFFLLDFYHYSLAAIGAFLYGFPSWKMIVIGVTGTSGKSTVVELTSKILEEAGYKIASLSSIKFKIGGKEWPNTLKMTMPGRFKIQKFLRRALKHGCKYVVLEVTSEGIKQYRHKFIDFDVAVFTNLSPEHIESHGGFKKYREAKSKLFRKTKKTHIINLDDENSKYFLEIPAERKILFRLEGEADSERFEVVLAENIEEEISGLNFRIKNVDFNLGLLGKFNIYNALAAICVGLSQGVSLEDCKSALEKVKGIPGRMEIVISPPRTGFTVIVDYAHTPDSLEKVYKNLSPGSGQDSGLICVLGACGGGRDKWKRPVLGEIAAKYCKEIIVTNEDPYDEDPMEIIKQVAEGTKGKSQKILDRRKAIKEALKLAKPNDMVIITGKGSEPWMCVDRGKKILWDDRKIVKEEFIKRYEILPHIADLKIRVFGRTKEELFSNALLGMSDSLRPEIKDRKKKTRGIRVKSPDLGALLVDFLSEVLYLTQVNKEIYIDVKFKKFSVPSKNSRQVELEGNLFGQKVERFGEDIKAVTYHNLNIHQKKDGTWEVTILFDI